MLEVTVRYNTMNVTTEDIPVNPTSNSEFYLLVIMIKLAILLALKICQTCANLYTTHNKRVIDKFNKRSIKKLQKARDDLEAGGTIR